MHYKDFSVWQNQLFESESMKKQEEYWLNTFAGEIPVLQLPIDKPRPAEKTYEGNFIKFAFTEELSLRIKEFAAQSGTTLYMTLLAGFNLLLARYSGEEDIVIGSPVAGRRHADLENVIGMFVNTLALRNYPNLSKTFAEFFEEVKENSLKAFENQDYQFEILVKQLDLERDMSRNALFDIMFVLQNVDRDEIMQLKIKEIQPYEFNSKIAKFDLSLNAEEKTDRILFNIEYCTSLFKRETIERLAEHYVQIITSVVNHPEIQLSEIRNLRRELADRNSRILNFGYPKDKTIHQLFTEEIEKTPNRIAPILDDQR